MHSFSLLFLYSLALFSTRTYACDDCWEWPEDDAVFIDEILNATNFYRAQHNASPLVWNETLAEGADGYVYGCKNYVPYVSVVARRLGPSILKCFRCIAQNRKCLQHPY
jgi:hypothetical protein